MSERIRGVLLTDQGLKKLNDAIANRKRPLSNERLAEAAGISKTVVGNTRRGTAVQLGSVGTIFRQLNIELTSDDWQYEDQHLLEARVLNPIVRAELADHNNGVPALKTAYLESLLAKVSTFPVDAFFHSGEDQSVALAAEVKVVEVKRQEKPSSLGPVGPEGMGGDRPTVLFGTPTPAAEFVEEAIKKSGKRQVLLLAEPGEGKSTLMRKLALAYEAMKLVPLFIECHDWNGAEVEAYVTERYPQVLGVKVKEREATGRWLWEQIEAGEAVLLFDGLDEASEPEAAARTLAELGRAQTKCRLVVTCRSATERNFCPQFHKAHLRPLEFESEIKPYVEKRLTDAAERAKFLATIHPKTGDARTAQLATSGICLAMLLFLWQDDNVRFEPPVSREALYEKLVETVFKPGRRRTAVRYPAELKTRAMEAAAFEALFRGHGTGTVPTETLYRTLQKLTASRDEWHTFASEFKEIADEIATQTGLLARTADTKAFRFFHLTLLEWFAARYLAREWNAYWHTGTSPLAGWLPERPTMRSFLKQWLSFSPTPKNTNWRVTAMPPEFPVGHRVHGLPPFRNLLFDPNLHETLMLLVGQMEAVEFSVAGKSAAIEAWWMKQLAATESAFLCNVGLQCLAQCGDYHKQVAEQLMMNLHQFSELGYWNKSPGLALLGKASGSQNYAAVTEFLLRRIRREFKSMDMATIQWCLKSIGEIGSADAVPILLECLKNGEENTFCWSIAEAIEYCVNESHVPLILDYLKNEKNVVIRGIIAEALGKIGSADAVPVLLECLRNKESGEVRCRIAEALGKIGSADAVPVLRDCLKNEEDSIVRWSIVSALEKIGSADAVPVLLDCLRNKEDSAARESIAEALGKIGSADAVDDLLECLRNEKDSDVRQRIINALGEIGFDALDAVCAARKNFKEKQVQEDLARVLYTLATIDFEGKRDRGSNRN
jgi:hypothetical protein